MLTILIIAGVLILVLLVVGVLISVTSEKSLVEERLGRYLQEESAARKTKVQATPVSDWLNRQVEHSHWAGGVARELARADIKLRTSEYLAIMVLSGMGVAVVSWFFGGKTILFALIGLLVGISLPRMYVRWQQGQRLIRFNDQLPDMLNLMVNGLRAGFSTMQAMEAVNKEMPPPISDEFRRVVQEMQLGLTMERALDNLLRRIPSDDLDLTIAAINVQREVGGNLAEILDTITYTIRERVRIKGEIRVLTTQVVYSGRFLSLMPIVIVLALWAMNRPYMMMFLKPETRMIGIPVLGFGLLMVVAGFFVMNKLAAIEV
ncbi:MAG TPA: type II secretion system F family protein [Anaerolineales bacterium]|nr:type II secretion system F family protein [Anaerolineales bacterium]